MTALFHLITIVLAYLYATLAEWVLHKYVLHGLGKNKNSWFNFHWHYHHKSCRKNNYLDENYNKILSLPVRREILGLYALLVIHLPIYFVLPYFYVHQKSHLNPDWAKKHIPWHHEHHMGKDQDVNWGVTTDIWDTILNTKRR